MPKFLKAEGYIPLSSPLSGLPHTMALITTLCANIAPAWTLSELWAAIFLLTFTSWYLKGTSHLTCPNSFSSGSPHLSDWPCDPSKGTSQEPGNHVAPSLTGLNIPRTYLLLLNSLETSLIQASDHFFSFFFF